MIRKKFGDKVEESQMIKFDMSVGCTCKVVPLTMEFIEKNIAYDYSVKRRVDVDSEIQAVNPKLEPYKELYMVIAKLNTDQQGNVVNSNFDIEYLKLSVSKYNDVVKATSAISDCTHWIVSKQEKQINDRKVSEFSFTPSNMQLPNDVVSKIRELLSKEGAIDYLFDLVDKSTSTSKETYLALLDEHTKALTAQSTQQQQPQAIPQAQPQMQAIPQAQPQMQAIPQAQPQQFVQAQPQFAQPQQVQQPQQFAQPTSMFGYTFNATTSNGEGNDPLPF